MTCIDPMFEASASQRNATYPDPQYPASPVGKGFLEAPMLSFTGYEYLLIDVATQYGHDKDSFTKRLKWAMNNLAELEELGDAKFNKERPSWIEYPLYVKAVQAIRDAEKGYPTGHLVSMDAACSGIQIMSVLTGCSTGCHATGLINPDEPMDAYRVVTNRMSWAEDAEPIPRSEVKQAVMTAMYGSQAIPKALFGEGETLQAFWTAMNAIAPGACLMLNLGLSTWEAWAEEHAWVMPDNHHVRVPNVRTKHTRVNVEELGDVSLAVSFAERCGEKFRVANVANLVHSVDAYVLRSLIRRCSYDQNIVATARALLFSASQVRNQNGSTPCSIEQCTDKRFVSAHQRFIASNMVEPGTLYLIAESFKQLEYLSTDHIERLLILAEQMLSYAPFDVITVHDEFKCHPNHMNQLRRHYREILSELAESRVLEDILEGITHRATGSLQIPRQDGYGELAEKIAESNYGIC